MFCPACGVEYSQKLNYCKNCGVELGTPVPVEVGKVPRPKFGWMFTAIGLLAILGTIVNFMAYYTFAQMGLHGDSLMVPFILGIGSVSVIALLLIRQLSRLISFYRDASLAIRHQQSIQPSVSPSRLTAPNETVSSIVEHTTRQFAPSYREPPES